MATPLKSINEIKYETAAESQKYSKLGKKKKHDKNRENEPKYHKLQIKDFYF